MRAPRPLPALPPALALLPLRAFLGVTFAYAGAQKLSDPGFLSPGSATYIGTQLHGFAQGTPGGVLLRALALPHPALAGVAVAVTEITVGVLVTLGLATRLAALAGLSLSVVLFLTASWHTHPYFLGSDIVFVFAWTPVLLAGARGQPALEHTIAGRPDRRRQARDGALATRREALGAAWGGAAAAVLLVASTASALKGAPRTRALASTTGPSPRPRRSATRRHARASRRAPAGGVRITTSGRLPRGSAALYTDPVDGRADIVVRRADGGLSACSAICTHAGCKVGYQGGELVCPCHGSVFDPGTGAVRQGPATQPLALKRVIERGGTVYAVRA